MPNTAGDIAHAHVASGGQSPSLVVRELTLENGGKQICTDLSLDFSEGKVWGVLGQNGIGKTTLLHTLAGLRQPLSGEVLLDGKALAAWPKKRLAQRLGILLQEVSDPFPSTVLDTALIGRHPYLAPWQFESAKDESLALAALKQVDLNELQCRDVSTLSGGERQRLALATLMVQQPDIFILDEPSNHLDLHYQITLLDLMGKQVLANSGLIVMTLHDINLAVRYCDHLVFVMGEGEVVAGPTEVLLNDQYLHRLFRHCLVELRQGEYRAFLPG